MNSITVRKTYSIESQLIVKTDLNFKLGVLLTKRCKEKHRTHDTLRLRVFA